MFLVPNIDQMYKEMKKIPSISQQSSVYCWIRKQTRKRRRISGFCRFFFFFGIKNVRVGGKILGSVGQSETHTYFFWPYTCIQYIIQTILSPLTKHAFLPNSGMYFPNFLTMAGAVSDKVTMTSIPSCLNSSDRLASDIICQKINMLIPITYLQQYFNWTQEKVFF